MTDCGSGVLHLHNLTLKPGTIRAALGQIMFFVKVFVHFYLICIVPVVNLVVK